MDKRNTSIQANRAAKTAMEVLDDLLKKDPVERNDLLLIVQKIRVFEDRLDVQLREEARALLGLDRSNCKIFQA